VTVESHTSPRGLDKVPPVADLEGPLLVLGVSADLTHPALQTDAFKELISKLAWVLGTTYEVPYSNNRTASRMYALRIARRILQDQGYPRSIARSNGTSATAE